MSKNILNSSQTDLFAAPGDGLALNSMSHPGHNDDMTGPEGTPTEIERARAAILAMSEREGGYRYGCISAVQDALRIRYNAACEIVRDLVGQGFVTEADDQGRRKVLKP